MYLWRNARVRTKVATCLLVATLGMAAFAATVVAGKFQEANDAAGVVTLASTSIKIGDLLHETQRARASQSPGRSGCRSGCRAARRAG